MIALTILTAAFLYIALVVSACVIPKTLAGRAVAVFIALYPLIWATWDVPLEYYHLKKACSKEGGLKVYKSTPKTATHIRIEKGIPKYYAEWALERYPSLLKIEAINSEYSQANVYDLYERDQNGKISATQIEKTEKCSVGEKCKLGVKIVETTPSKAKYILRRIEEKVDDKIFIHRTKKLQFILLNANGDIIATTTRYSYRWGTFLGGPLFSSSCGGPPYRNIEWQLLDLISIPRKR